MWRAAPVVGRHACPGPADPEAGHSDTNGACPVTFLSRLLRY
jgi:hypothetical protein